METLAHVALWRYPDGHVGAAALVPRAQDFIAAVKRMFVNDASYDHSRDLFLFSPAMIVTAQQMIARRFSPNVCFICQKLGEPCWFWAQRQRVTTVVGSLVHAPMTRPTSAVGERRALLDANPTALSQLANASIGVRDALSDNAPAIARLRSSPMARPNQRELDDLIATTARAGDTLLTTRTAQAPTPVGTIRCTHCGQVIPPGFDKAKDTKKTEDEIYAECEHNFDEEEYCRKCKLKKRVEKNSRFSWLEVD